MSLAAQLAERIVVGHREPGYLRLELPGELCAIAAATEMAAGLRELTGITVATVDGGWRQLYLRYDISKLTVAQVATHLYQVIDRLPVDSIPMAESPAQPAAAEPPGGDPLGQGIQSVLDRVKALVVPEGEPEAGSLQARIKPVLESALTEKAITNFLNDILAFYLIKMHWDLITRRWLQNPLAHSNAWLTTFYLIFLLIRYRKSQ